MYLVNTNYLVLNKNMAIIREIFIKAEKYLKNQEIMLFIGPRQAGKTTIMKMLKGRLEEKGQKNIFFLNLEDVEYLELLNKSPKNIFKIFPLNLQAKSYLFIDEVQYLKNPSNFLKYLFDEYAPNLKLIVSGSSAFYIDKKFKDSLAGRKKIFEVSTLSFAEFLLYRSGIKFSGKRKVTVSEKEKINDLLGEYMIYGGYPRVVLAERDDKEDVLREIAYSFIKKDILDADIKKEEVFFKLFKLLSAQTGQLANANELAGVLNVSKISIENYLYVMQKSFHIALVRPFSKNLRKELIKMPKVFFGDLGLRNFFANNLKLPIEQSSFGGLLENAAFRMLKDGYGEDKIRYWRTADGKEIDFIIEDSLAIEVKTSPERMKMISKNSFHEEYPDFDFLIMTHRKEMEKFGNIKVVDLWDMKA